MNLDLWKKNPVRARELLTYLDPKGYTKNIFIPVKGEDDNVNFYSINNFLAPYGIGSCHLRKIGADYASRVHGGKNDSVSDI